MQWLLIAAKQLTCTKYCALYEEGGWHLYCRFGRSYINSLLLFCECLQPARLLSILGGVLFSVFTKSMVRWRETLGKAAFKIQIRMHAAWGCVYTTARLNSTRVEICRVFTRGGLESSAKNSTSHFPTTRIIFWKRILQSTRQAFSTRIELFAYIF